MSVTLSTYVKLFQCNLQLLLELVGKTYLLTGDFTKMFKDLALSRKHLWKGFKRGRPYSSRITVLFWFVLYADLSCGFGLIEDGKWCSESGGVVS